MDSVYELIWGHVYSSVASSTKIQATFTLLVWSVYTNNYIDVIHRGIKVSIHSAIKEENDG